MTELTWASEFEAAATGYGVAGVYGAAGAFLAAVASLSWGLEALRWLKDRPKLDVTLMPVGSDTDLLAVNVVNLGSASVTIESLSLAEFTTFWRRWLRRPNKPLSYLSLNPTAGRSTCLLS